MLHSSKLKEFADDNFKFDKNGRKLSKQVENTVGKGEIALRSNFSFYHSVFKRLVSQRRQKVSLCGNGLKRLWEKINTAINQHFVLIQQYFQSIQRQISPLEHYLQYNLFYVCKCHLITCRSLLHFVACFLVIFH